jgi:hypothetical protein
LGVFAFEPRPLEVAAPAEDNLAEDNLVEDARILDGALVAAFWERALAVASLAVLFSVIFADTGLLRSRVTFGRVPACSAGHAPASDGAKPTVRRQRPRKPGVSPTLV